MTTQCQEPFLNDLQIQALDRKLTEVQDSIARVMVAEVVAHDEFMDELDKTQFALNERFDRLNQCIDERCDRLDSKVETLKV